MANYLTQRMEESPEDLNSKRTVSKEAKESDLKYLVDTGLLKVGDKLRIAASGKWGKALLFYNKGYVEAELMGFEMGPRGKKRLYAVLKEINCNLCAGHMGAQRTVSLSKFVKCHMEAVKEQKPHPDCAIPTAKWTNGPFGSQRVYRVREGEKAVSLHVLKKLAKEQLSGRLTPTQWHVLDTSPTNDVAGMKERAKEFYENLSSGDKYFLYVACIVGNEAEEQSENDKRTPLEIVQAAVLSCYYKTRDELKRSKNPEYVKRLDAFDAAVQQATPANKIHMLCGCSPEHLVGWIELLMVKRNEMRAERMKGTGKEPFVMTWDNYPAWELDHASSLKELKKKKEPNLQETFRYTNLNPLMARANRKKSGKEMVQKVVKDSGVLDLLETCAKRPRQQ
jgi:hypothetical protein